MIGLDIYGRIDEIQRTIYLAGQLADMQAQRSTLLWRDGECVRHLRWAGETWQCDCTFSRTHDRQTDPCRHVRALEMWHKNGELADPRLMILDETLFMGNRRFFVSGSSRQMTYEAISERWRCIAQAYVRRQTG